MDETDGETDFGQWKRTEARLRAFVDHAVDGFITIDEFGLIQSFNPACERLFGYAEEEVLRRNLKMLMPSQYHAAHETSFHRYLCTGEARVVGKSGVELSARRKDGSEFPIDLSVSVFSIDDRPQFAGIIRDITKKKQAEAEALRDTRALLRSNRALDEFAYAASHDLRAPLRVIDNASKWLEEDLAEHLSGENLENMQLLRSRIRRLERLLDDMLAYSRIGRKFDENYTTKLTGDALVADVLSMVTVPEGFNVIVSPAFADIEVCRMPLQQVLMNLITNAIKHHDQATGHIEISVETGASEYTFAVRDDGPGVPAEFRERIFRMLETLKPKDRVEGNGMGLAMVRSHVEFFGGTITAEPAEGRGSIFRFTWPILQPQF